MKVNNFPYKSIVKNFSGNCIGIFQALHLYVYKALCLPILADDEEGQLWNTNKRTSPLPIAVK
ncbi:hypothetical protein T4A_10055 [Trichinella pseudospiralis]|uniref:Uncharacterized protein n=1 Tax=Trichinella pseudospiralis TaxID=6337 RepID=A0A0V1DQM2_TRIPS|nr:hypothetical protein T4A_10055 [Trichinella pseudospiralis]